MTETEIRERISAYKFYHTIQITDGISTPGWPAIDTLVAMSLRNLRALDLKGKRVLDIGCRDGLFCFEAEKLGAREVIGIDSDLSIGARDFLIPLLKSKVQMHEMNLLDLTPQTFGEFDVVIFPGVLYHLRYPFWALKLVRDVMKEGGRLLLETAILVDDNKLPLLYCPIGSESPYEATSCTFYNIKGLADTLFSLGLTVQRVETLNGFTPEREPAPGAASTAKPGPLIDRANLVCQRTSQIVDKNVAQYWDGSAHLVHTKYASAIEFEPLNDLKSRLNTTL